MTMTKRIQAKHIDEALLLAIIRQLAAAKRAADPKFWAAMRGEPWVSRWDIERALAATERYPNVPEKVLLAKLRAMVKRKILDGCTCGCRGDFEILPQPDATTTEHRFDTSDEN